MSVLVFVFALCCAVLCCASASALVCTCPCFVCVLCQSAFLFQQETERERRVLDRLFEEQTETLGRLKGDYDSACQALHAAAAERDALSDANSQLGRQVSALEAKLSSQESDLQGAIASALQHCAALRAAEHDNQRVLDALQAMDSFSGVGNPVKQQMVVSGLTPSPSSHQRLANALFDGFTKALCN
eukprot:m.228177 g.228177  ORF g.228177 m.228177 type:complete len:187 (+) comp18827_c0_seq2:3384-3944(+)